MDYVEVPRLSAYLAESFHFHPQLQYLRIILRPLQKGRQEHSAVTVQMRQSGLIRHYFTDMRSTSFESNTGVVIVDGERETDFGASDTVKEDVEGAGGRTSVHNYRFVSKSPHPSGPLCVRYP